MTSKNYQFWNSENIYQAPAVRNLTIDFFSTLKDATLNWSVSGTAGFDNIQINGVTVGTTANGSANVKNLLKNGQSNNVTLNYRCDTSTIIFGQPAGNVRVYLTVNGDIANYQILLSQNATFKQAYINGQVSFSDYQTAMAFQNGILQQLLALNLVTAAQYQAIMDAQTIVPSNGDETGNTDIGGGNNNSGSTLPSVTVGGFNVLPLIAILTGVIGLALAYWYFFKRRIPQ